MSNTKTFTCKICGQPTTAHAPGCSLAPKPKPNGDTATANSNRADTPKRRISDREAFVRAGYLVAPTTKVIAHWRSVKTYSQDEQKEVQLPALVFTDGKIMRLNPTHLQALALMFNDDETETIGKAITLRRGKAQNGRATIVIVAARINETTGQIYTTAEGEGDLFVNATAEEMADEAS